MFSWRKPLVVLTKPSDKIENVGVAPHPCWKALEVAKRLDGLRIAWISANETIDAICVRPVGFDGDCHKLFFPDQPFRDLSALLVKLMRAMRCLSDQNKSCVADPIQERIVVMSCAGERMRRTAYALNVWRSQGSHMIIP